MDLLQAPILFKENIFYEVKGEERFLSLSYNKIIGSQRMPSNHFHPFYEIYYLQEGTANYLIEGKLFHIKAGDIILIKPYVLHKTLYPHNSNNTRYLISFNEAYFYYIPLEDRQWLLDMFNQSCPIIQLESDINRKLERNLLSIRMDAKEKKKGYHFRIHSIVEQLLLMIKEKESMENSYTKNLTPIEEKILEVVRYIHEHYEEVINLTSLAERFYMSSYYLAHKFRDITGFTVVEYIQLIRIKKAQQLLESTQERTIDICQKCGFGSISQFNRVFRKVCGTSPGKYRN